MRRVTSALSTIFCSALFFACSQDGSLQPAPTEGEVALWVPSVSSVQASSSQSAANSSSSIPSASPSSSSSPTEPAASGSVAVTLVTASYGGEYAPRNIVAVWISDSSGNFVRTLGVWARTRIQDLTTWSLAGGNRSLDGTTGATRQNHSSPLSMTWDLKDRSGAGVAEGTYQVHVEVTEDNTAGKTLAVPVTISGSAAHASQSGSAVNSLDVVYQP